MSLHPCFDEVIFAGLPRKAFPTDKIKGLWDPKRTSTSPKTSWNWIGIIHNALTAVFWDQCHGVRSHGTSSSQGWRTIIVIQHSKGWSMSYIRVFNQPALCRNAKENLLAETGICRHQCFSAVVETPQDSPNSYFRKKELDGTIEPIARMNAEWRVEKAEFAEFNLPTCGNIAVWQLCRERQPLWKSHDGLNLSCLDQCHGVRSLGASSSQGWRKILVIQSRVSNWSMSLHLHTFTSVFSTNLLYVGLPRKAFPAKQAKVDTGHHCFSVVVQATPQDSPNGYFQMKELDRTIEPIARMNVEWKLEKAEFAEFNLPNVATLQFDSCGLNLTCLDQCHGVRSQPDAQ